MFQNDTNYETLTPAQIRESQRQQIEQWDREIELNSERRQLAFSVLSGKPDPLREKSERELEKDIFSAVKDSRNLRASLAQIARYNSIPVEAVESVAQQLASDYLGLDLERLEFESMSEQIQKIEAKEKDAGIRDLKLHRLAKRHGLNRRVMMECYNKSLCSASMVRAKPIGEFLDEHLQTEVQYLVQGWIPQGVTMMLHGDGGAGKTLFLYELMERVLRGRAWSGYPCQKAEVLLVQVDEPETITAERIDIRGIDRSMPLKVMSDWQVEQMPKLEAEAAAMPKGSLIIVDSLTAINRNCYYSENDTEYARPVLQMRDLARKFGHTVILVHHSNADGRARGTRAIHNSVDIVWALSLVDQSDRLLRIEKMRRGMPIGRYKLAFDDETFKFTYRGEEFASDEDFEKAQTQKEKIRLWLGDDNQRGRLFEPMEVSEALGISRASARKYLRELMDVGAIDGRRKPGTPYYLFFAKAILNKPSQGAALRPISDRNSAQGDPKQIQSGSGFEADLPQNAAQSDPLKAIPNKSSQGAALRPSDPSDPEKNEKNHRHFSLQSDPRIASTPQSDASNGVAPKSTGDPSTKNSGSLCNSSAAIDNSLYNPLPEKIAVGDTVLVTATAQWIRSGSDKLPWKEVPPSQRSATQIPINTLGQPVFDELIEGGKVIEIRGDRSRVRNQKTGRTSMFLNTDLRVLRSEDKS